MPSFSKRKLKQGTGQSGNDSSLSRRGYDRNIQRQMEKHAHEFNLTIEDVREKETFAHIRKKVFGK